MILFRSRTRRPSALMSAGSFQPGLDVDEERPEVSFHSTTRNLYRLEAVILLFPLSPSHLHGDPFTPHTTTKHIHNAQTFFSFRMFITFLSNPRPPS